MLTKLKETQPNSEQSAAINHTGSPLLLIAGAGSGKTETLVKKVAKTIESGIEPSRICMMTFTNKAAESMIKRVSMQHPQAVDIVAGTFHGIAYRLLNEVGFHNGFYKQERILSNYQADRIWEKAYHTVFNENERGDIKKAKLGGLKKLRQLYSKVKTQGYDLSEIHNELPETHNWDNFKTGCIHKIFDTYSTLKVEYNGFDFDDLLVEFFLMLQHAHMREEVQKRFDYFFVDEYQDTSWLQGEILKSMVGSNPNLCVVGDPNQCIYSFMAAQIDNILSFKKDFPNATIIKLNRNYRSIPEVISLSNTILDINKEKIENPLVAHKTSSEKSIKPILHSYGSANTEAIGVIRDIKDAISKGYKYSDIAILSRLSFTTRNIEMELTRENIPFVKVGGLKVTDKINIRQFLAFLELALNKYNWLAWEVLLPMLPHIGKELTSQIVQDLSYNSNWEWSEPPAISLGSGKRWKSFKQFWDLIKKVEILKDTSDADFMQEAFRLFTDIYVFYWNNASETQKKEVTKEGIEDNSIIEEIAKHSKYKKYDDHLARNLFEIEEYIVRQAEQRPETVRQFLDQFHLNDTSQELKDDEITESENRLIVSTIHSAKGLEWPVVFVVGLEVGTLPITGRTYGAHGSSDLYEKYPSLKPFKEDPYLEEENRLFYVAVTRAEEILHITKVNGVRLGKASKSSNAGKISPFIKHMVKNANLSGETNYDTHTYIVEKIRNDDEQFKYRKAK